MPTGRAGSSTESVTPLADEARTAIEDEPAAGLIGDERPDAEPTGDDDLALGPIGERDGPEGYEGTSAEGAWLELAVAADVEAVAARSQILSRVAPGGTRVGPAYEVLDEGPAARVDPGRPATV